MLVALALFAAKLQAAELLFAPESMLTVNNVATLGDFQGVLVGPSAMRGVINSGTLKGRLEVTVTELSTGSGPRDARMQSYCLESARFPTVVFDVATITGDTAALRAGDGTGTLTLIGSLTIRDVTMPATVPASFTYTAGVLRLSGRYDMDWTAFGVPDPGVIISALDPHMYVTFDIVAGPATPP